MKRLCRCQRCVQAAFSKIHIVDRCLLLFMVVLLAQSAFSLFFHGGTGTEADNIDIIVRTSTAAIFGYFLSANFIRHSPPGGNKEKKVLPDETVKSESLDLESFHMQSKEEPHMLFDEEPVLSETETEGRMQILVAASIGLFCLISLLILRNMTHWNPDLFGSPAATATIAQFRDFVSGCVGFLISCPTNFSDGAKS